jgi:hypothetical protein
MKPRSQAVYDSILARSAQAAGFTFDGNKREPRSCDKGNLLGKMEMFLEIPLMKQWVYYGK